jgi:hypothetical protein
VSNPMPSRLLYGPDRLPLEKSADATGARWGHRPFHGIVSLGLRAHPACTPERWRAAAPLLDSVLGVDEALAEAARGCGVLSFDESLAAAAHAAREYGEGASVVELWNLKEGHTTSVWRATYASDDGATRHIVLNVARDDVASHALQQASAVYAELAKRAPDAAAATVLATWQLRRVGPGAPVTVAAQGWIDDAYEINALPVGADARVQLVAVERFLTDPAEPARIRSVRGRRLTAEEHERVGARMALLLSLGARRDNDGTWRLPTFALHHGDWVWQDDRAVAVACGARPTVVVADSLSEAVQGTLRDTCRYLDAEFARAMEIGCARRTEKGGDNGR